MSKKQSIFNSQTKVIQWPQNSPTKKKSKTVYVKKACSNCKVLADFLVYTSLSTRYCRECFVKDREEKRELVNKLPDIADKKPPLGYGFVANQIFVIGKIGKAYADTIYKTKFWGAVN